MKSWGIIRYRHLFSSESDSKAISSVVGSILMLMILVLLVGAVTITSFNIVGEGTNSLLVAKISLESCDGGLSISGSELEQASFEKNKIILVHDGGSPLPLDTTCIQISGDGNAYQNTVTKGGHFIYGSTQVIYKNLGPYEKNITYATQNDALLKDGFWNVGERLILHGRDSWKYDNSSVKVSVNGDSNTSDNYGFKVGSEIIIKVIDVKNRNIIAEQKAIVKHYEKQN